MHSIRKCVQRSLIASVTIVHGLDNQKEYNFYCFGTKDLKYT